MHKTEIFSYNFLFFILFILLVDIIGIKPAPGKSNFKKVGAISSGSFYRYFSLPKERKYFFWSNKKKERSDIRGFREQFKLFQMDSWSPLSGFMVDWLIPKYILL